MSNSRLFKRLREQVSLIQSDTTVGFVSQNHEALAQIKERDTSKPFVKVYPSFKALNQRIPITHKRCVRRSLKKTFVLNNQAFRVIKDSTHQKFLSNFKFMYSTSANEKSKPYKRSFCEAKADIIIEDIHSLHVENSSQIIRLHKTKKERLR